MEMKCEQVAEMQAPYYNIKNAYPQNARFTAEESERGNVIENDLYTQVLMMTTKFIVGDTEHRIRLGGLSCFPRKDRPCRV